LTTKSAVFLKVDNIIRTLNGCRFLQGYDVSIPESVPSPSSSGADAMSLFVRNYVAACRTVNATGNLSPFVAQYHVGTNRAGGEDIEEVDTQDLPRDFQAIVLGRMEEIRNECGSAEKSHNGEHLSASLEKSTATDSST